MLPTTFDALDGHCIAPRQRAGGRERAIPCDLVPDGRWGPQDLARIRAFAASADLDVIALQEIDGREAARRIFPEYVFCFTNRHHVQNVGFAIRRGIPHRCDRDYRALGLPDDDLRRGADLTLYPGTDRAIRLLAVHLKSSCNSDPLDEPRDACRQAEQCRYWRPDRPARTCRQCLRRDGDFNCRFDLSASGLRCAGRTVALWPELNDGELPIDRARRRRAWRDRLWQWSWALATG
jgi:hypothetical protein